jgi:hypothetical protein
MRRVVPDLDVEGRRLARPAERPDGEPAHPVTDGVRTPAGPSREF